MGLWQFARQQSKKKAEAEALRAAASNHHYFDRKAAIKWKSLPCRLLSISQKVRATDEGT